MAKRPLVDHAASFFAAGMAAAWLTLAVLQGVAIERQSLIGDAAYHLLAGDQALRQGQNRLNLEHPPLVKLVAALPLLGEPPLAPPVGVDRAIPTSLELYQDPGRTRRAQRRSRTLVFVVFGLPLLAACWALGRRWGGSRAGAVLALAVGLSFAVLPFLTVIQTDAAVTLGFVVTLLALIRYLDAPGPRRALVAGLGLGLAMAAKFSGVLLWPVALVAFVAGHRGQPRWSRRSVLPVRDLVVAAAAAAALVWVTYAAANHAYDPATGRDTIERYLDGEGMITDQKMQRYRNLLLGLERVAPNLAQWLTGLLGIRAQDAIGVYPAYAFGDVSSQGRWWFFPAVFLIKTPLALLLALAAAALGGARRPPPDRSGARPARGSPAAFLVALAVTVYLGAAMTSNYNLGVRHLLPILPFVYLPAAVWAAKLRIRSAFVVGLLALESVALAPVWMSSTNTWWLGDANPTRFALAGGDTEYHQNFIALARYAEKHRLEPLTVLYPLLSEAELHAYLPRATLAAPGDPLEPGWVAVNVNVERYLPAIHRAESGTLRGQRALQTLARDWTPLWQAVAARGEDHGYVAGTFHLYRLPSP